MKGCAGNGSKGQPCLALFDRGGRAAQLEETLLGPLNRLDVAVDWLDEHQAALV